MSFVKRICAFVILSMWALSPCIAQNIVGTAGTTVSVTPTVTASSTYSAGNEVGGLLSFGGAVRLNQFSGVILSVQITVKTAQTGEFDLYLCDSNPTASTWTDKTGPSINVADVSKCKWFVALTTTKSGLGTHTVYMATGVDIEFALPQTTPNSNQTTLYGVLVTVAQPSAQFSSSSDVTVSIGILQD